MLSRYSLACFGRAILALDKYCKDQLSFVSGNVDFPVDVKCCDQARFTAAMRRNPDVCGVRRLQVEQILRSGDRHRLGHYDYRCKCHCYYYKVLRFAVMMIVTVIAYFRSCQYTTSTCTMTSPAFNVMMITLHVLLLMTHCATLAQRDVGFCCFTIGRTLG